LRAQRGLGDVQPLGSATEVQLFGDGDEVAQVAKFQADARKILA
jgi:hypothetical protein